MSAAMHQVRAEPTHPSLAPEILRLRNKIEILEETNRQLLESMSGRDDENLLVRYKEKLGLSTSPARLLIALVHGSARSRAALTHVVSASPTNTPDARIVNVYVARIRKSLKPYGLSITTDWGIGFHIDEPNRAGIRALIEGQAAQQ
jgi:DNA-binding response OmpR family regulator